MALYPSNLFLLYYHCDFSIAVIILTRSLCLPPSSNSAPRKAKRISSARHSPTTLAPMHKTFASLCILVILADSHCRGGSEKALPRVRHAGDGGKIEM